MVETFLLFSDGELSTLKDIRWGAMTLGGDTKKSTPPIMLINGVEP